VSTFSLRIEKEGRPVKEILSIGTDRDVNMGDIELEK
jgi:hypothetical protein